MKFLRHLCTLAIRATGSMRHQELMKRVQSQRDRIAFRELAAYFAPRLRQFLASRGASRHDADEVTQETLLAIWAKASSYDASRASLSTWIYSVARNRWIDRTRKAKRYDIDPKDPAWVPSAPESPDEAYDTKEREKRISIAMNGLTVDQAEIMRKVYFDGKAHRVVAEELDIPVGTVKSRIRLALGKLRNLLFEEEAAASGEIR
jgi:RNA polymerase sigma factor (sigma-70 family)